LSPDRNGPCPCGSGKKYKKCHGLETAASVKSDPLAVNRIVAYKGAVGRRREIFCREYAAVKRTTLTAVADKLRQEAAATGKTISCGKGCSHCCKMFVVASLQECEAIVYHLYNNESSLKLFIRNFPRWNERVLRIDASFRRMNEFHARMTAGEATKEEIRQFDLECDTYAAADIPCPFLSDNACAIYDVRPYVCARIVAITPSDWCRAGHPRQREAIHLKAQMQFEKDMPYFEPLTSDCVFSSMPFLVYSLLQEGYTALLRVPGLEKLKEQADHDLEVQVALKQAGLSR
jgi:Fe-S-cluster containining protein